MTTIDILGYLAGAATTVSFLPQVIKVYKTKSAKDLSLWMFLIFVFGVILWFIYGVIINSLPMMLANGGTIVLAGYLLFFKIFNKE